MREIAGLALAVLLVTAPSAAARPCFRLPAGEAAEVPIRISQPVVAGPRRTEVAVCDRGRRVVLRRARLVPGQRRGVFVAAAAAAGRRVAWIETRVSRRGHVARVVVALVPRRGPPRRLRRTVVLRDRVRDEPGLDVLITRHGELAWVAGTRVVLDRPGGRRVLARNGVPGLALEDGRTLRWSAFDGRGYLDLRPWPGHGCPARARFQVLRRTPTVQVTRAVYPTGVLDGATVIRACLLATGRDPVVLSAGRLGGASDARLAAVERQWVVVVRETSYRQAQCTDAVVRVVAAGSGRVGGGGPMQICHGEDSGLPPYPGLPIAVSEDGAVAWMSSDATEERLMAFPLGAALSELDRGTIGAIAGLHAEGRRVVWTHAGVARSADLG